MKGDNQQALSELSAARPDWRFGQMIANIAMTAGRMEAGAVGELEDQEALKATQELLMQYAHEIDANS